MKTAKRRIKDIAKEAEKLALSLQQPGVERKCCGSVKLRDAAGEYLRDEAGKVLTRPCKNAPIRFGTVCPKHGGKAPQVKAKAEQRFRAMLEPSIVRLEELAHQDEHLPTALGAVLAIQNRVLGQQGKESGEKDMRPVVNIRLAVGGIPLPGVSTVKVGLLPEPAAEGEVIGGDAADDDTED